MDVFRQELHGFALRAVLDEAEALLGRDTLSQLVTEHGASLVRLTEAGAWVSLELFERLIDALIERARDPALATRAMVNGMSPKYLGPLYSPLFAFGTPSLCYSQLPRTAVRLNNIGRFALQARRRDFARIVWRRLPGAPRETRPYSCDARRAQLEQIPTAFDLEPAQVEHPECLLRGDPACVYEVRWHDLRKPLEVARSAFGSLASIAKGWTRKRDTVQPQAPAPVERRAPSLLAISQRLSPANEDETRSPEHANGSLALIAVSDLEQCEKVRDAFAQKYRVQLAATAAEAFELADSLRPDVVIADVESAEASGLELCRRLRAGEHTKALPVMLLTAAERTREGFDAGATDCVAPPWTPSELTARADLHVRVRRLTNQLARQERLAALGSLAASVAHNVRNPLSALISGLPAMRKRLAPHMDERSSELMDVMLDCASRIERLTLDLLDLARIDRDSSGEFAPGSGLLACTRMFATRMDGKTVDLTTDVDVLAMASGRAGDVNHVFMNVIDNALRAIGGKGRIAVRGFVDSGYYVVTIGDSGPGIADDQLARVFEPFWTTRTAGEGVGLGLAIARQIVEEHGGTISAGRSALGGAEVTIRVPLRRAERAA